MNAAQITQIIERAETRRRKSWPTEPRFIDAYRVLHGAFDGAPEGLSIDRYDRWLVVSYQEEIPQEVARSFSAAAQTVLGAEGVVEKRLARTPSQSRSTLAIGTVPSEPIPIREGDAVFLCELNDGMSTGLFLDQREMRFACRSLATNAEVLNLFAYTCSFSVHAALGGASRVTSVDVSKKALSRGRQNMEASGLDPNQHRWFDDEVFQHLRRAERRGARYGLVILDPPSVGRSKKSVFSLPADLDELVRLAMMATAEGGVLVASAHQRAISAQRLEQAVRAAGRKISISRTFGVPAWDHPSAPGGAGDYLTTLVISVG